MRLCKRLVFVLTAIAILGSALPALLPGQELPPDVGSSVKSRIILHGEVIEVSGDKVRIAIKGKEDPHVGDPVKISYEIPGADIEANVARGKVAKIESGFASVDITDKTGEIRKGYRAEISSTRTPVTIVAKEEKFDLTGVWTIKASPQTAFGSAFTRTETFRLEESGPAMFMISGGNSRARIQMLKEELRFFNEAGGLGATGKLELNPNTSIIRRVLWSDGSVWTRGGLLDRAGGEKLPEPKIDQPPVKAENALAAAEAALRKAQERLERSIKLYRDGAISEADYEADRLARDTARAQLSRLGGGNVEERTDLSGRWEESGAFGKSIWTLKRRPDGRYDAQQAGLSNASGSAVLTGDKVKIDWATKDFEGFIEITLNDKRDAGKGQSVIKKGADSTLPSRFKRLHEPDVAKVPDLTGEWAGRWTEDFSTDGLSGKFVWTLKRRPKGSYDVEGVGEGTFQSGGETSKFYVNTTGTWAAEAAGNTLRFGWNVGGYAGSCEWTLRPEGNQGGGKSRLFIGPPEFGNKVKFERHFQSKLERDDKKATEDRKTERKVEDKKTGQERQERKTGDVNDLSGRWQETITWDASPPVWVLKATGFNNGEYEVQQNVKNHLSTGATGIARFADGMLRISWSRLKVSKADDEVFSALFEGALDAARTKAVGKHSLFRGGRWEHSESTLTRIGSDPATEPRKTAEPYKEKKTEVK